jgi:endogenous inhibitor of DNA gyrase (YacG/DUF329 family)
MLVEASLVPGSRQEGTGHRDDPALVEEAGSLMMCPQCGGQVPTGGVGRPRRFCSDESRRRWHADTSIIKNELSWRLSLPPSNHNTSEISRLTDLIASRR